MRKQKGMWKRVREFANSFILPRFFYKKRGGIRYNLWRLLIHLLKERFDKRILVSYMTELTFFHFRSFCLAIHKRLLNILCFQRFEILPDLNICFSQYCKTCSLLDTHKEEHRWHPVKHVFIKLKLSLPCNWGEPVILLLGTIAIESFMWVKPEKNNAMYIQEIVTTKLFFAMRWIGREKSLTERTIQTLNQIQAFELTKNWLIYILTTCWTLRWPGASCSFSILAAGWPRGRTSISVCRCV